MWESLDVVVVGGVLEEPASEGVSARVGQRKSDRNVPLWSDLGAGANEVASGEDELCERGSEVSFGFEGGDCKRPTVVQHPLWVVVESIGRMQTDNLVVLDRDIAVLVALAVSDVHEETAGESATDVVVVGLVLECGRDQIAVEKARSASERGRERSKTNRSIFSIERLS